MCLCMCVRACKYKGNIKKKNQSMDSDYAVKPLKSLKFEVSSNLPQTYLPSTWQIFLKRLMSCI